VISYEEYTRLAGLFVLYRVVKRFTELAITLTATDKAGNVTTDLTAFNARTWKTGAEV
jgi:hypothetical protein